MRMCTWGYALDVYVLCINTNISDNSFVINTQYALVTALIVLCINTQYALKATHELRVYYISR